MRRLLLISAVVALLAPGSALALRLTAGDGTLVVRNGSSDQSTSVVALTLNGSVVGQLDQGRIVILDQSAGDGAPPDVTGAEHRHDLDSGATTWSGSDLHFRAIGGTYRIRIFGRGIDLNAVGQGKVTLIGSPTLIGDGRYSLNGNDWASLPDFGATFTLGS